MVGPLITHGTKMLVNSIVTQRFSAASGHTYRTCYGMRSKTFRFFGICLVFAMSMLITCDPFREDVIPIAKLVTVNVSALDYYILPNSSTVINMKAIVTSSFTNVSVKVSEYPKRGTLIPSEDFFLKYTPSPSFSEDVSRHGDGEDQFKVAFTNNEKILTRQTIILHMSRYTGSFPCSLYAVEDVVHTAPGIPISIKVLFNDRLCGIKIREVQVAILSNPQHGQTALRTDSIIYTPETHFEGSDEIVYKISAENKDQTSGTDRLLVSYGLVKINITE